MKPPLALLTALLLASLAMLCVAEAHAALEPPTNEGYEARRQWLLESFRNLPNTAINRADWVCPKPWRVFIWPVAGTRMR